MGIDAVKGLFLFFVLNSGKSVWICGTPRVHDGALPPLKPLNKGSSKFPLK